MNRQQMEQAVSDLNQRGEVEEARIVEFLGKPHVHIDFQDGNIGVIGEEGTISTIQIETKDRD